MDDRLSILSPPSAIAIVARLAEEGNDIDQLEFMTIEVPGLTGIGLGPIDTRFLTRQAWPIQNAEQVIQYRKFAQLMIHRIRAGESNDEETERFTYIFNWTNNWMYLFPVLGMLPELDDHGPPILNEQMNMLVDHIGHVVDARTLERMRIEERSREEQPSMTAKMVTEDVRSKIARLLLGPEGEANASPAVKRLLTSWVEVGYPKAVIQKALDETGNGRSLARNDLGLPTGLLDPSSTNQYPNAMYIPSLPSANSIQKLQTSVRKARPSKPKPAEYLSSDDSVEHQRKTSYKKFPHPAIDSSPELSVSPPKTFNQNEKNKTKLPTIADRSPNRKEQESNFWNFHKSHRYDYEKYLEPVTEADRVLPTIGAKRQTTISTEKTKDGMVVARGFNKLPPAKSDGMLKEVIEDLDTLDSLFFPEEEPGDEALYEEESSDSREARIRRQKLRSVADNLSQGETVMGKYPSSRTTWENSPPTRPRAPARPPGLPSLEPHEVMRQGVEADRTLEDATNMLESMVMAEGESFQTNLYDQDSWKPLGESGLPTWGPKKIGAQSMSPESEGYVADEEVGNVFARTA